MLGIKRECVLTLDVKTKEVLDMWELKTIHSYFSTPTSFCLVIIQKQLRFGQPVIVHFYIQNFGGYRSGLYIVKTTEGESIVQLLDGYIQLIQQTVGCTTQGMHQCLHRLIIIDEVKFCPPFFITH